MKLHEIKSFNRYGPGTDTQIFYDVELGDGRYAHMDIEVTFEYEGESSTQHEPGDPTTTEYHSATFDVLSVRAIDEIIEFTDSDDASIVTHLPIGTDILRLPGISKFDREAIEKMVKDRLKMGDE